MDIVENLLKIKSIVTILLTGLFCYMAITGKVTADQVTTAFMMIIAFYFGTQAKKGV